jgi:cyclopropane fatty-acyl-phospholipid synthase-like methyltransferase
MTSDPRQQDQRRRFDELYERSLASVMVAVERKVCGCDYGGSSWTTRAEAEHIADLLKLEAGDRLLEVGAGSGWPGLYLAERTGCDVVLVDLPFSGLRIARERVAREGLPGACWVALADGAGLPFRDASFDAVSHSDVLCCLPDKRGVLAACRRVIRASGRMVFSVISVAPGLTPGAYARAVENGPEFIEAESDYATLLAETGWTLLERQDLTGDYAASCRRQIQADEEMAVDLRALLGAAEFEERLAGWHAKLAVLGEGLLRRELFTTEPA